MPRLLPLTDDLQTPLSRIGGPGDAYNYAYDLIQADDLRAQFRTYVQGNIDGNAPFPKSRRDRTNLNFRQGAAIITQFQLPYYDLLCEVPYLAEVETVFGNSEERGEWSQMITEEFHHMVTSWEDWDQTMQQVVNQMLVHNIGHLYWENNYADWRPEPARMNEILVADQSPVRLSKLEAVVIRKGYLTTELMQFIEEEREASLNGWNIRATKQAVKDAFRATAMPPDNSSQWEYFQQKRKNADLYFGAYECERVWSAHCMVREYNGKISNHLIRTDQQIDKFLYSNLNSFDSMEQLICPFFYDIGNGTWHSGAGLGKEVFPYCQVFNSLRCREVDAALISASVLVQAKDSTAAKQAQMWTLDSLKIIPEGVTFLEHQIGQNIQATVDVRRDMEQGLNQNIGALMKAPGTPNPRKGQKQAILEMQQAAQIGKGKINLFYGYMDRLYRNMFAKAVRLMFLPSMYPGSASAKEMWRRLQSRGVPREALKEIDFVKAYRSVGAGSAANALMITESLLELAPSLSEPGRMAALRLYVSRLAGSRAADMLCGEINSREKKTGQMSIAQLENIAMRQGGKVIVSDDDDNVVHLQSHNGDAMQHLQEIEGQAHNELQIEDLQPVYVHLNAYVNPPSDGSIPTSHGEAHLQQISDDPIREKDYKELKKQFEEIVRYANKIKNALEQMIEARKKQQQEAAANQPNLESLKLIDYKSAPEGTKARIEEAFGAPRNPGELSVPAENTKLKEVNTELKAERQQQQGAADDIRLSREIKKDKET